MYIISCSRSKFYYFKFRARAWNELGERESRTTKPIVKMVPIGKIENESAPIIKRPLPVPPKPSWCIQNSQENFNLVRPSDLKFAVQKLKDQPEKIVSPTTIGSPVNKVVPVPLPRLNSNSSNDSAPKTPIPLPRTKFNIITTDATPLERSASLPTPTSQQDDYGGKIKPELVHSVSDPSDWRRLKQVNNPALPAVAESNVFNNPMEIIDNDEEDGDTWL